MTVRAPILVCAGISVEDMVFQVERFATGPTKIHATSFDVVGGGNAANAAIAAARLGSGVRVATAVGDDAVGRRLVDRFTREGIDTSFMLRLPGVPTPVAAITVDIDGNRQAVVRRDDRIDVALPDKAVAALLDGADALVADTRMDILVPRILDAAKRRGLLTMLDGDRAVTLDDPMLSSSSHIIFSADALRETAGDEDLAVALRILADHTDAMVGVTDSERGSYWWEHGRVHHMPAFRIPVVDTLGAGDVFHAAVTLRLVAGDDIEQAFYYATAAAALKCMEGRGGDGSPRREAVEAFLAEQRIA